MRIGELAARTDVSVQTLRYYERRGLLSPPPRQESGYRRYNPEAMRRVRFIRRARQLGFTLEEIGGLLDLRAASGRSCGTVEKRATETLERIDGQIRDLKTMRAALAPYVTACRNRKSIDECPLLLALGGDNES